MSTDTVPDIEAMLAEPDTFDADTIDPKPESMGERIIGRVRKKRSDAGKPRGTTTGSARRPSKAKIAALADKLAQGANLVAAGLMTVDPYSSTVVAHNAERLGNAWAPVIASNSRLARMINQLEQGGNIGAALLVTGSVALPILVHHRPQWFPSQVRAIGEALGPQAHPMGADKTNQFG